jgi:Beige/BEACH domain/PH domain associated with Beige/BEACH/WD domain, G-beta repeat
MYFDTANVRSTITNPVSKGFFGIRLMDDELDSVHAAKIVACFYDSVVGSEVNSLLTTEDARVGLELEIDRRVGVNLAAQVLALLDVFIFPDSLDATLPVSQLHGLALVRNTESRVGGGQGPLLASLVRLSLVLLNQLEPCSVSLLQCSSRLRCFLHWIFEMIRETEALDGYSATFNKLTAPFDRLVLCIIVQCREVLRRGNALQAEIEAQSATLDVAGRESRKKSYRRLLRVSLEMREILVTILEQRSDLLRASFSESSFEALKLVLGGNDSGESSKERLVQQLLGSDWVNGFEGMTTLSNVTVPNIFRGEDGSKAIIEIRELQQEARDMSAYFEKSLNACFERYLEAQRKWAETGAVRDLEFEGDITLKKLATRFHAIMDGLSREMASRRQSVDCHWHELQRGVGGIWSNCEHWRIPDISAALGKRLVLVPNASFHDHSEASYELLLGREREREERERQERQKKKEDLAELMKRNSNAFLPIADSALFEDDEDRDMEAKEGLDDEDITNPQETMPVATMESFDLDTDVNLETDAKADAKEPASDDMDAWARTFIWSESEAVVARFDSVVVVTLQYLVEGKILLTTHALYFHQTGDKINTVTKENLSRDRTNSSVDEDRRWRLNRLTEVHGRRYMLRAQALELFFSDCFELFINFANGQKDRNRFYAKLRNSCRVPMLFSSKTLNPRTIFRKSNIVELWRKRRISNFDYILSLNRMAGRTFNDIAQYPVFPWILADYSSEKIDLSDSRVYRDLSKPVGALNPDRLSQLLERYKELEQFGFAENERFLYGSHYSSPGVILHFLIRQEPFTSMAIDLQSGRFDCPDRLFFDLQECWRNCNSSSSDVKELIPEFFTLPEMFLNTNNFPLGKTQRGQMIHDVNLPPWAKCSAYEFVRIHRLALESEHVSRNLHHWIDLVFGFKQRGPEAEAAHNIFHHLSYEGAVDLDKINDELDRQATESHIQNFGQTPSQLLPKESHPGRLSAEESWYPLINNVGILVDSHRLVRRYLTAALFSFAHSPWIVQMSSTVRLRCHTPGKQYGGKKSNCGSAIKIGIQSDSITVIYSDLKVGIFKWYPKASKNRLKAERLRPLPNRLGSYSRAVIKRGSAAPQAMDDVVDNFSVGNWSVALTLGGYEKEQIRRKALMPSRLASAKDALYTDSAPLIISCGYWDNTIKVHSTDAWKLECVDSGGHRGCIRCLSVADDGAFMVTGSQDCTCRVWVIDHPDLAVSLADGYIQTALGRSTDAEQSLSCCHVLWGHESAISCVDLSSELDVAVSGSLDGKICVHSLRRGKFIRSFKPSGSVPVPIRKVALDKHGRLVIFTGDSRLHTYTINGICLCIVDTHERIHDMIITGEVLITGGDKCHVYIRDLATLKVLSGLDLSRHGPIRSISLTPEDLNPTPQHLFIGSDNGMISIVDRDDIKVSTGGR